MGDLVTGLYDYYRKFGARRTLAASLMYASRRLSRGVDVGEVDRYALGTVESVRSLDARLNWYDFSSQDLQSNRQTIERWGNLPRPRPLSTMNWFVVNFQDVYAGVVNIFRFIDYFERIGVENRVVVEGGSRQTRYLMDSVLKDRFPSLSSVKVYDCEPFSAIPYADVSVATYWTTAYLLMKFNKTGGKYYFIQDDERMFFESGAWSALVEETYRFGFLGIASAESLKKMYQEEFQSDAESFSIAVDTSLFRPDHDVPRERVKRVFFYARPNMPRNGFDLGMLALGKIKGMYQDLEIVTAGENLTGHFPFKVENLGYLTIEQTASLYRTCDLGLFIMFSRHPGVIPLELMASGCTVVSNKSRYHESLTVDDYNCLLSDPTVTRLVETIQRALEDFELRKTLVRNGIKTAKATSWEPQFEKIRSFIVGR